MALAEGVGGFDHQEAGLVHRIGETDRHSVHEPNDVLTAIVEPTDRGSNAIVIDHRLSVAETVVVGEHDLLARSQGVGRSRPRRRTERDHIERVGVGPFVRRGELNPGAVDEHDVVGLAVGQPIDRTAPCGVIENGFARREPVLQPEFEDVDIDDRSSGIEVDTIAVEIGSIEETRVAGGVERDRSPRGVEPRSANTIPAFEVVICTGPRAQVENEDPIGTHGAEHQPGFDSIERLLAARKQVDHCGSTHVDLGNLAEERHILVAGLEDQSAHVDEGIRARCQGQIRGEPIGLKQLDVQWRSRASNVAHWALEVEAQRSQDALAARMRQDVAPEIRHADCPDGVVEQTRDDHVGLARVQDRYARIKGRDDPEAALRIGIVRLFESRVVRHSNGNGGRAHCFTRQITNDQISLGMVRDVQIEDVVEPNRAASGQSPRRRDDLEGRPLVVGNEPDDLHFVITDESDHIVLRDDFSVLIDPKLTFPPVIDQDARVELDVALSNCFPRHRCGLIAVQDRSDDAQHRLADLPAVPEPKRYDREERRAGVSDDLGHLLHDCLGVCGGVEIEAAYHVRRLGMNEEAGGLESRAFLCRNVRMRIEVVGRVGSERTREACADFGCGDGPRACIQLQRRNLDAIRCSNGYVLTDIDIRCGDHDNTARSGRLPSDLVNLGRCLGFGEEIVVLRNDEHIPSPDLGSLAHSRLNLTEHARGRQFSNQHDATERDISGRLGRDGHRVVCFDRYVLCGANDVRLSNDGGGSDGGAIAAYGGGGPADTPRNEAGSGAVANDLGGGLGHTEQANRTV